jgi:hypothetical protein
LTGSRTWIPGDQGRYPRVRRAREGKAAETARDHGESGTREKAGRFEKVWSNVQGESKRSLSPISEKKIACANGVFAGAHRDRFLGPSRLTCLWEARKRPLPTSARPSRSVALLLSNPRLNLWPLNPLPPLPSPRSRWSFPRSPRSTELPNRNPKRSPSSRPLMSQFLKSRWTRVMLQSETRAPMRLPPPRLPAQFLNLIRALRPLSSSRTPRRSISSP